MLPFQLDSLFQAPAWQDGVDCKYMIDKTTPTGACAVTIMNKAGSRRKSKIPKILQNMMRRKARVMTQTYSPSD